MTDTLYIIGNGFDLHHGLMTSYLNFRDDYVKKKSSILWNYLLDVYGDFPIHDDLWWRDFENMLGRVDYVSLANSLNGETMGFMKVRNLMQGALPPLFGKWISEVDSQVDLNSLTMIPEIDKDSLFFTFNYTLLLERAYKVDDSRIWHIHGSINHPDDILVGHDFDGGKLVKYVQEYNKDFQKIKSSYADTINQYVINGAKKVKDNISSLDKERKFDQYSDIKHYVAMGFSFNDIDMPYIKKIIETNKHISDADWTLYWYLPNEDEYMINKLLELGIVRDNINKPIRW